MTLLFFIFGSWSSGFSVFKNVDNVFSCLVFFAHNFLHLLLNWLIFYCLLFQEKILFGGFFARNSYLTSVKIYRSHTNITTTIKSKTFGFLFRNLLQSSEIFWNNRELSEIAEIPWYTKQNILAFLCRFCFFLEKI